MYARRRAALGVLAASAVVAFALGATLGASHGTAPTGLETPAQASRPATPAADALGAARSYAAGRRGRVAFAVADSHGRVRGFNARGRFVAASVVKAMLLVAYLDQLAAAERPLSESDRDLLEPMILVSDNDSASEVYERVGDAGLRRIAARAGLRDFQLGPANIASCRCRAGAWARAQISAADQARFMRDLEHVIPRQYLSYAKSLLAGVVSSQRWGIPEATGMGGRALLKGGLRTTGLGVLVHQIARVETGGKVVTIAVLTDGNPSRAYGIETVRGVARALLARPAA